MAKFEIVAQEGLKMVRCVVENETVRAESGALRYLRGTVEITSTMTSAGGFLRSLVTKESVFRPTYQGTGEIYFGPPIFGEYELLQLNGEEWILEAGAYVCSDGTIEVGVFRNKMLSAMVGGKSLFQTRVRGTGQVVMQAQGPVQRIELKGEKLAVDGKLAIARTGSLQVTVRKATRSLVGSFTSGEGFLSIYEGQGTVLMVPMPNLYENLVRTINRRSTR